MDSDDDCDSMHAMKDTSSTPDMEDSDLEGSNHIHALTPVQAESVDAEAVNEAVRALTEFGIIPMKYSGDIVDLNNYVQLMVASEIRETFNKFFMTNKKGIEVLAADKYSEDELYEIEITMMGDYGLDAMYKDYGTKFKKIKDFNELGVRVNRSKFTKKELTHLRWLFTNIKEICLVMSRDAEKELEDLGLHVAKQLPLCYKLVIAAHLLRPCGAYAIKSFTGEMGYINKCFDKHRKNK
jgi:hypothetical protein